MIRVLVVQRDRKATQDTAAILTSQGFEVKTAVEGGEVLRRIYHEPWDLVILDADLPGEDGFQVCQRIQENTMLPVIMLTAQGDDDQVVRGLEAGADDYVTKPVSARVFLARVNAVLRRSGRTHGSSGVLRHGELLIDLDNHEVTVGNVKVQLSPSEFGLLYHLVAYAGQVLSAGCLLREVQGYNVKTEEARGIIKVHIYNLRRKIKNKAAVSLPIRNVRGAGYMVEPQPASQGVDLHQTLT